jgi:hypothetical protein
VRALRSARSVSPLGRGDMAVRCQLRACRWAIALSLDPWIDSVVRRGGQLKVPFGQGGSGLSRP